MVFYVYASHCVRMGRNNGEDAEVAISCPVDSRSLTYYTFRIKALALKNGAKASLYPRLKRRGFRAKVGYDKGIAHIAGNSKVKHSENSL